MAIDILIKKAFVSQILREEMKRYDANQTKAITKLLHFQSGRLENERTINIIGGGKDMDGQVKSTIPFYGRILDIKPKNRKMEGLKKNIKRMIQFPIYNRFVFGHYYTIAYKLNTGLTKEVAENLKKDFEKNMNLEIEL